MNDNDEEEEEEKKGGSPLNRHEEVKVGANGFVYPQINLERRQNQLREAAHQFTERMQTSQ